MKVLTIDIETVPRFDLPEACVPKFDIGSVKYGNLKDPVKRKALEEKEEAKFNAKLNKKMSTDPTLAQMCTFVGMVHDTDTDDIIEETSLQVCGDDHDDYELAADGWALLQKCYRARIPLVTFNGQGFDLQVMYFRAMAQDVPVDKHMYDRFMLRYKNPYHYDLMQILANWDRTKWKGLDFYLNLFGLGSKGGMSGADVYPAYMAGEYEKIKTYCRHDVTETYKLFARLVPWIGFTVEDMK